jgi:hypothetical protein
MQNTFKMSENLVTYSEIYLEKPKLLDVPVNRITMWLIMTSSYKSCD